MSRVKLFVDMDGVLCDFHKAMAEQRSAELPYPQSNLEFFLKLESIPGAVEAVRELGDPESGEFDVFILTAPSTMNPHCWTEKAQWVAKHLGTNWLSRLIITERKDLLAQPRSLLIDDMPFGKGQEVWAREHGLVLFGPRGKFKTWAELLPYLKNTSW